MMKHAVRWGLAAAGVLTGIGIATAAAAQADAATAGAPGSIARSDHVRAPAARRTPANASAVASTAAARADLRRVGLGAVAGATQRSNQMYIIQSSTCCKSLTSGGPNISFTWSGQNSITGGQPWGGITSGPGTDSSSGLPELQITAFAGRKGSSGPANWFVSNSAGGWFISDFSGGESGPTNLNFAFTGTLTVIPADGSTPANTYTVVIGQGHVATVNNWWMSGPGWTKGPYQSFTSSTDSMISPDGLWMLAAGGAATTAASSGFVIVPASGYQPS